MQAHFERRREQGEVRQAKRMIAEDVLRIAIHLRGMATSKSTPRSLGSAEAMFLPTTAWKEYGPVLARHWKDDQNDEYDTLSLYMTSVSVMRSLLAGQPANAPLGANLLERVEEGEELVAECYTILTGNPVPDPD